jgi:aerobic carbon-monoxide dehydrogenase medium subunit
MIPAEFDYVRAGTIDDALAALAAGDCKLIAGGHSLIPLMRFRLAEPARLVDIDGIAELKGVAASGSGLRIGAGTAYRDLLESKLIASKYPLIIEATTGIGDLQVRNRGTIGGALAHADPASDMPAVMLALTASFNLRSASGQRTVAAADFFHGMFTTALREDEILVDIVLPAPVNGAGSAWVSFEQKASGYAIAAAAAIVTKNGDAIASATIALAGVGDRATLADTSALAGIAAADGAALDAALAGLATSDDVNSDIHASAEYRAHLARVAARRAVQTAFERAG